MTYRLYGGGGHIPEPDPKDYETFAIIRLEPEGLDMGVYDKAIMDAQGDWQVTIAGMTLPIPDGATRLEIVEHEIYLKSAKPTPPVLTDWNTTETD